MAFMITGSSAASQDLVQDAFIGVFRKPPRHRRGSLKAYLSTVVYHMALKEKKRSSRTRSLDEIEPVSTTDSPLEEILSREKDRKIARAIRSLDRAHRDIIILRFYGEHSYETIARMTNLPLGTVKSRIFYGVKSCRKRMKEEGLFE
jgi:RNA polymerase sigma-70 factor (ECF subfamily)